MDIFDKIEKVSELEANKYKYMYGDMLVGLCSEVFDKVGVPRINPIPEEYFDAFMNGVINSFYDGCEPEFETEEEYDKFESNIKYLKECEYMVEEYKVGKSGYNILATPKSPYKDKKIPFLGHRND